MGHALDEFGVSHPAEDARTDDQPREDNTNHRRLGDTRRHLITAKSHEQKQAHLELDRAHDM